MPSFTLSATRGRTVDGSQPPLRHIHLREDPSTQRALGGGDTPSHKVTRPRQTLIQTLPKNATN